MEHPKMQTYGSVAPPSLEELFSLLHFGGLPKQYWLLLITTYVGLSSESKLSTVFPLGKKQNDTSLPGQDFDIFAS